MLAQAYTNQFTDKGWCNYKTAWTNELSTSVGRLTFLWGCAKTLRQVRCAVTEQLDSIRKHRYLSVDTHRKTVQHSNQKLNKKIKLNWSSSQIRKQIVGKIKLYCLLSRPDVYKNTTSFVCLTYFQEVSKSQRVWMCSGHVCGINAQGRKQSSSKACFSRKSGWSSRKIFIYIITKKKKYWIKYPGKTFDLILK